MGVQRPFGGHANLATTGWAHGQQQASALRLVGAHINLGMRVNTERVDDVAVHGIKGRAMRCLFVG